MTRHQWLIGAAVAAAAIGGALYYSGATKAADLGGNCCADLEERIAELEATVARKGNRKVSLTLSGQVSRSILFFDGGSEMMDNFNSPSRFTLSGSAKLNKDWSAGYVIELGITDKIEDGVTNDINIRHNALWIGTPLGKVWLGHTSTATDGIVEINTANVNVAALPIASFTGFDGARDRVLKYESASLAGFEISAAWIDGSRDGDRAWDVALRYAGEAGGFKFAAGIGYGEDAYNYWWSGDSLKRLSGSASLMHTSSGLFAAVHAGRIEDGGKVMGGTAGIERNFFAIGKTTIFAEYSRNENGLSFSGPSMLFDICGVDELEVMGLGIVQNVQALQLDVFATYRQLEAKTVWDTSAKTDVILTGARIKF